VNDHLEHLDEPELPPVPDDMIGELGAEEARIRDELAQETSEEDFLCFVEPDQD
jgi:hypothetical protein